MEITSAVIAEDFEDFLDDEYCTVREGDPITADTANYYAGRVKKNNEEKKNYEATAKELKAKYAEKIDLWLEKRLQVLDNDNSHCMAMLEEYFHENQSNPAKKVKLPNGSIGFYKTRDSIKFGDALLDYVSGNEELKQYIVTKYSVDTAALRKDGIVSEVTDEAGNSNIQLKVGSQVLPGELVNISLGSTVFSVR